MVLAMYGVAMYGLACDGVAMYGIPTELLVLGGHGAGTPPLAGRATRHLLEPPGVLWRAALGSAAPRGEVGGH